MRLLIVEDSDRLRENLAIGLRRSGYAVDEASTGTRGLWLAESNPYDVIVLDVMLPELDGFAVVERLRRNGSDVHVLMLTAKDRLQDKVDGLQRGADDYLVKPFAFEELLARLGALVRRRHGRKASSFSLGSLLIDTVGRTVSQRGQRLDLSAREFAVLEYLAARRGSIVSRAEIETHVYDGSADLMSNVVDTVIYALRKKLDAPGAPSLIRTHRNMGYELLEAAAE